MLHLRPHHFGDYQQKSKSEEKLFKDSPRIEAYDVIPLTSSTVVDQ